MKVCVLIPTFNESKTIGGLVADVKREGYDVLVVDDGSRDDTARTAKASGASIIVHEKNMGKGASLKAGFAQALKNKYDAVVVMDGDGQHMPEDIKQFVQTAQSTDADLIIGNRMQNAKTMPLVRWMTNKWMSFFISKVSGQYIPDTQCGFRLIKRKLIEKIKLISSKYETESEILIRAGKNKFKIRSVPIKSIYNGEISTIHPIKDPLRFIRLVINIMFERKDATK